MRSGQTVSACRWQWAEPTASGAETLQHAALVGRLDAQGVTSLWAPVMRQLAERRPLALQLDLGQITFCDGAGIGLLTGVERQVASLGGQVTFQNTPASLEPLLAASATQESVPSARQKTHGVADIGRATLLLLADMRDLVAFVGELSVGLLWALRHPRQVRWRDAVLVAEKAGVNALPVVCLLGGLMGLIIAFQAAIPMSRFGAEPLIPQIIGIAMVRELGPLMTAILLAGRSGSAFAAEIGTMKVTEEINALTTFGLDPVRFLVLPRTLAVVVLTPLLSLFGTAAGVLGGYVVMAALGYSLAFYRDAIYASVGLGDLLQGVFKAGVFALLVGGIGCLNGLRTEAGPGAVGASTTRAVVAGIVLIVVCDGVLGVVFYYLGI